MKKITALLLAVLCSSAMAEQKAPLTKERLDKIISESRLVSCNKGECWDYFTGIHVDSSDIEPTYVGQVILIESDEFTDEEKEEATPFIIDHFKEMDQRVWGE